MKEKLMQLWTRADRHFWLLYVPLSILYMETVLKFWCFGSLTLRGFLFTCLFSLATAFLFTGLCVLLPQRLHRLAIGTVLFIFTLIFCVQAVYYKIFKTFLTLFSLGGATGVLGSFWREALQGIWNSKLALLLLLLPAVLWPVLRKKIEIPPLARRGKVRLLLLCLIFHFAGVGAVAVDTSGVMSASYIYFDTYVPELSVSTFGVLTNTRLDALSLIRADAEPEVLDVMEDLTPEHQKQESIPAPSENPEPEATPEPEYGLNMLEIDFDALLEETGDARIQEMHRYFSAVEPTMQNEYTGYFEGKNLIWILAEGFSTWALDETHTPTLSMLAKNGFVFENFYNPLWYVSTSDGEYTTLTSLLPRSGVWSMAKSGTRTMPYGFGTLFGEQGYTCHAFHNGTNTYYDRHVSHPNLGYNWIADGSGLQVTDTWPPSDLEMIENSVDYYLGNEPFHTYYMTISGHLYYTFSGNMMARKHQEEVQDLDLSENCKAYIACHMELDLALEKLLDELEAAGVLEDTVIVLSGDHYPYGLTHAEVEELNGGPVDPEFELYKSTLIIWNAAMEEPIPVEKTCCALDIMPTLCNLFGLEYDSRLIMGRDIFSDSESLVVFGNRSFMTDYGRYSASTDSFEPADGVTVPEGYALNMLQRVNTMFTMSDRILDYDYYSIVLGDK